MNDNFSKTVIATLLVKQKQVDDKVTKIEDKLYNLVDIKKGEKGDSIKGDKGDKGENGRDGKDGLNGRDGINGKDGKDGKDGKNGIDGKDGRDGLDGKDGDIKELSPDEIRDSLELLQGNDRLDKSAIRGLEELIDELRKTISSQNNRIISGPVYDRILIDDLTSYCNGTDKTFYLTKQPKATNKIMVWGTDFPIILRPNVDWTLSGRVLTLTSEVPAPNTGATLLVQYTY